MESSLKQNGFFEYLCETIDCKGNNLAQVMASLVIQSKYQVINKCENEPKTNARIFKIINISRDPKAKKLANL